MKKFLLPSLLAFVLALLLAPLLAHATDYHRPPATSTTPQADSTSNANASSTSGASTGGIDYYNGGSRSYALFSGGATPLPPTTCPKGDSSYVQIAWGLLTVASSTTRTEMDCLEKVLAVMRASPMPQLPKLPTTDAIHPPIVAPALVQSPARKKGSTAAGTTIRKGDDCKRVVDSGNVLTVLCVWT